MPLIIPLLRQSWLISFFFNRFLKHFDQCVRHPGSRTLSSHFNWQINIVIYFTYFYQWTTLSFSLVLLSQLFVDSSSLLTLKIKSILPSFYILLLFWDIIIDLFKKAINIKNRIIHRYIFRRLKSKVHSFFCLFLFFF